MIWPFKSKKLKLVGFISEINWHGSHYWALYIDANSGERSFKRIAGDRNLEGLPAETLKKIIVWKYGGPLPPNLISVAK